MIVLLILIYPSMFMLFDYLIIILLFLATFALFLVICYFLFIVFFFLYRDIVALEPSVFHKQPLYLQEPGGSG